MVHNSYCTFPSFFALFDNDRAALAIAYAPSATFSFSANTDIPARARISGFQHSMPNQMKLTWSEWLSGSRNLTRGPSQTAVQKLHVGQPDIIKSLQSLPGTKHELGSHGGGGEKWCLDAWPTPIGNGMGLLATIHGEFIEGL